MKTLPILAALCLLATTAKAQERTAAGAMDTQMTWSALSSRVNAANTKADAINARVDQGVVCATKGMLYAPGAAGVDGQGCKSIAAPAIPKNCAWAPLPYGLHSLACPASKVMAGLQYEGATWTGARDNHAGPEIPAVLCCSLQ